MLLQNFTLIIFITMMTGLLLFVPFIPTPRDVVRFMVKQANLKGNEVVYDLGCGDGRLLIEAKKQYPGIRAIGYELALGAWMVAKLRSWIARKKIELHMRDFFAADLKDADVLLLYLIPEVMKKVERKLSEDLKPGTRVISHGFEFKGREPISVERCPLPKWHFFRPSGRVGPRVFVYQW